MPRIPFATQSAEQQAAAWSAMRVVNLMARPAPPGSRVDLALVPTPGLEPASLPGIGLGPIRAGVMRGDFATVVSGSEVYDVNFVTQAVTLRGALTSADESKAIIDASATQAIIVAPPRFFTVSSVGVLSSPTLLPGSARAGSVAVVDGFAVFTEAPTTGTSAKFWVSNLLDLGNINALNFASAESATDGLLRAFNVRGDLWLFGTHTTEVWGNAGTVGVPFQRRPGGTINIGIAAPLSPAMVGDGVCWLGHDLRVYRSTGGQPVRISTHAIEGEIAAIPDITRAKGSTLVQGGHEQYVLNLPAASGRTFVWDAVTNLWHERQSGGQRWLGEFTIYHGKTQYVGSRSIGLLMRLSPAIANDYGEATPRIATLPPLWAGTKRAFMSRLELEFAQVDGDSLTFPVEMEYSDDGGRTFINRRTLAQVGGNRAVWHRLGSFRQRTIRFTFPQACRPVLFAADAEIEGGVT